MKWHGVGNDFILMKAQDLVGYGEHNLSELAVKMCHRQFGVGADGIMVAFPSNLADFKMVYYNSDGSYAAMCGNGIRCFAAFCAYERLLEKNDFTVETGDGIKSIHINTENGYEVTVEMGTPVLTFSEMPTTMEDRGLGLNKLQVEDLCLKVDVMKVGVPHTVVDLEDLVFSEKDFRKYGSLIEKMTIFPEGTNVNFVKKSHDGTLRVDTWERGAGLTLACGTGVCASAYSYYRRGLVELPVSVEVAGGVLQIDIIEDKIYMTGPAKPITKGFFLMEA